MSPDTFRLALGAWLALSVLVVLSLQVNVAPYGRHTRPGWGPTLPARAAWILMELPAVVVPAVVFAASDRHADPSAWAALALWEAHYLHRTLVYPLRMRPGAQVMPLSVMMMALVTNLVFDGLVAWDLFHAGPARGEAWLSEPRFWLGTAIFAVGMVTNRVHDGILRALRRPGERGYHVPEGGLFRWVSAPNYLGELVGWTGFALATASPAAWCFLAWSAANLAPRAVQHHRWYQRTFPDYPPERRALVPWLL